MSQSDFEPSLDAFERALRALTPTFGTIDRDRLMFAVGQASAMRSRRRDWVWAGIATCLGAWSIVATGLLALGRQQSDGRVQYVAAPTAPLSRGLPEQTYGEFGASDAAPHTQPTYFALRNQGIAALDNDWPSPSPRARGTGEVPVWSRARGQP
jgi:hypothetical protein